MTVYNVGLDRLRDIASADLRWLLLKGSGYTFNPDHATVSALTPGSNEVTVSGYGRVALTSPGRAVDNTTNRINYTAGGANFGTLASGQSVSGLVLIEHVTNDSDSLPLIYYAITPVSTTTYDPFVITFADNVIAYSDEAA